MNSAKRRGRKPKPHVTAWQETIFGLRRRPCDGKWQLADGRVFTEPDEERAVERFRIMNGQLPVRDCWRREGGNIGNVPSLDEMIRLVCAQIRERPQYVAKVGGIEQIAYLTNLKPPEPLPSPGDLRSLWEKHATCGPEDARKVGRSWDYFIEQTKLTRLDEVTPEVVVAFRDNLHDSDWSGKTQSHVIGGIRRVINLAIGRAIAVEALTKIQTYLGPNLLYPSESTITADPRPISPEDFHQLLANAEGQERAFVLLMLNAALYVKEVIALEWPDLKNGCLLTRREKTGRCIRAAILWTETLEALASVPRKRDEVFVTYQGLPFERCGGHRMFQRIATTAGVAVTGSQLRDGAYTEAVAANIQPNLVNVFVGHKSGLDDRYVLRNPKIVRPCTDAVYRAYFRTAVVEKERTA